MSPGTETFVIEEWMYGILSARPTLITKVAGRIHEGEPPNNPTYPLIVYNWQAGNDVRGIGATRIMANCLYLVRAITKGDSFSPLVDIVKDIDAALHDVRGNAPSGAIISSWRVEPYKDSPVEGGVLYKALGGLYRVLVRQTT